MAGTGAVDTHVVVVGAGPVGLMLAGELRLGGVDVVVLERLDAPTAESRASTLHARTMEILGQRGLLDGSAVGLGGGGGGGAIGFGGPLPPREPKGHFGGLPMDLTLPSAFPGQWKVPQTRTEEILGAWATRLGAQILRGHRVTGLTRHPDRVTVTAEHAGGRREFSALYAVGCDGEHSAVRRLAGIAFPGNDAERELIRADVDGIEIRGRRFERLPNGLAIAARRGDGVTRVMVHRFGTPPRGAGEARFTDIVSAWRDVTGEDISHGIPLWVNSFGDASRQAGRYRDGRVLLAGDAAHQQMPIGGQALNLGLQDAVNLGWKLAATVRGRAPEGLLDTYHRERHAVGRRVLSNIRAQARLLLGGPEVEALRTVIGELTAHEPVRAHLAGMISGLDVRHGADHVDGARDVRGAADVRGASAVHGAGSTGSTGSAAGARETGGAGGTQRAGSAGDARGADRVHGAHAAQNATRGRSLVGARLPEAPLKDVTGAAAATTLQLLRPARAVLLVLTADATRRARLAEPAGDWSGAVDVVTARLGAPDAGALLTGVAALLVRPDGYIAWAGDAPDGLHAALARWFTPGASAPEQARDASSTPSAPTRARARDQHTSSSTVGAHPRIPRSGTHDGAQHTHTQPIGRTRRRNMGNLTGKTALVTGASRGMGRATAERLARDGALVAVHYGSNEEAAAEVVAGIEQDGGRAFAVRAELGTPGDVHELFLALEEGLKERTGSTELDILVNNAGVMGGVKPEDTTPEQFDRIVAVNAKAPFFIIQRALANMPDGGRIVNISSGLTRFANPDEIAYAMSKGAVEQLALHFAKALGPRGITVNSVAPGITRNGNPLFDVPEAVEAMAALSTFNRVGEPRDVADVVAFLVSDDARWVTGSFVDASGGTLLG
ncbi:SDR family oxidoreductase [Streptomyces sp. MUM 2J]|uniref:SDR family oxidoreductase n=1 Tax=Streptomyces sp. MUM 2J TaxID=2791987 RepID=UPI0027E41DE8|nr:SDR family oxidoreductase [Streptomyces sp. MUM 2J]